MLTFRVQEIRNILSGLDHRSDELEVLNHDDEVYVTRDLSEKWFRIYAVSPKDNPTVDPIFTFDPDEEHEFGFFNRYFMVRDPAFDATEGDDPTDIPGVGP